MLYAGSPEYKVTDRDIQHLVDLYDDEIRYFDDVFQQLIRRLADLDQLNETIIVLASDHGEEFLEHGHIGHCRGVWDTLTRVPLVLSIPGVDGGRLDEAVENLDIVPTILDYLAIDGEGLGFEGRSPRPLIEGREHSIRYAFAKQTEYRSTDDGRFHPILDTSKDHLALFDIRNDPLEQDDLYDASHPELGSLSAALEGWLEETGRRMNLRESVAADRAKEEELRALG
jgi:arylsulfatase A-like enzyme